MAFRTLHREVFDRLPQVTVARIRGATTVRYKSRTIHVGELIGFRATTQVDVGKKIGCSGICSLEQQGCLYQLDRVSNRDAVCALTSKVLDIMGCQTAVPASSTKPKAEQIGRP